MRALPLISLLGLLVLSSVQAGGSTYRWVDERGRVHYSDIPVPSAEQVDIKPGSGISASPGKVTAASMAVECQRRKDQLTSYNSAQEITETDALGKTRSYTAAERVQLLNRVQQQVQEACPNVDPR